MTLYYIVALTSDRAWSLSFPETAQQQRSALAQAHQVQFSLVSI